MARVVTSAANCEFGAAGGAVVVVGQDVQAGGADLDLLARTQRHGRSERPPAGGGGQRAGGAAGCPAGPANWWTSR